MISVYQLKPAFQGALRPIKNTLVKMGITANQVTVFTVILSLTYGFLIYSYQEEKWPFICLPLLFFVRMALNAIDGMIANENYMKTPLGCMLNEIGDVISDTFLYLPFVFLFENQGLLFVLIILLSIFTEMIGVVAVQINASCRYDGPMGKSDRAVFFGALGFYYAFFEVNFLYLEATLWLIILMLVWTIINRGRKALHEVNTH